MKKNFSKIVLRTLHILLIGVAVVTLVDRVDSYRSTQAKNALRKRLESFPSAGVGRGPMH
jgi:hypothetical protein